MSESGIPGASLFGGIAGDLAKASAMPALLRYLAEWRRGSLWEQAFAKATDETREMPDELGARLAQERSLLRFCFNSFRAERQLPSPSDFMRAVAFECYLRHVILSPTAVEQFGRLVWRHWFRAIQDFVPAARHFESERGRTAAVVLQSPPEITGEVRDAICDARQCEEAYFRSYGVPDGTETIRVWLQGGRGWNDHQFTVDVPVLSSRGLECGFFRIGFNYFLVHNGNLVSLNSAHENPSNGDESARFAELDIGVRTDSILWMS